MQGENNWSLKVLPKKPSFDDPLGLTRLIFWPSVLFKDQPPTSAPFFSRRTLLKFLSTTLLVVKLKMLYWWPEKLMNLSKISLATLKSGQYLTVKDLIKLVKFKDRGCFVFNNCQDFWYCSTWFRYCFILSTTTADYRRHRKSVLQSKHAPFSRRSKWNWALNNVSPTWRPATHHISLA